MCGGCGGCGDGLMSSHERWKSPIKIWVGSSPFFVCPLLPRHVNLFIGAPTHGNTLGCFRQPTSGPDLLFSSHS